jgi:hypothetical protein
VPEGLKTGEMAGEITRHKKHTKDHHEGEASDDDGREHDRVLSVVEAVLLAIVALLAAYTGYASAKWSTESSVRLAGASAARTEANRAALDAQDTKDFDSTTFNAWFTAYVAGNGSAEAVAERRFRPAFKVAFDAWIATQPFTNSSAPPGPTYMPEYQQPQLAQAATLDKRASTLYALGVEAGANSDNYVRDTIYLATILFLIGISGHFRFFRIRLGLAILGGLMLVVALAQIVTSPPIP